MAEMYTSKITKTCLSVDDNMSGLLAFRVGNYDNTAEREQFRFLCEQLKTYYENSNEFCVLVGNYNIGCELDALFIKKDAIISIEFKNYGGHVVANENGEWTCDGVTIKGGSRKTVLQQARINHSIVKKELNVLGVDKKQIKDVPHLVVFHQDIKLDNKLSATNKSWLHITDNAHFLEKVEDITCKNTDISNDYMQVLLEKLALDENSLCEEYSNKKLLGSIGQSDKENSTEEDSKSTKYTEYDANDKLTNIPQDEISELFKFTTRIVGTLFPDSNAKVHIYKGEVVADLFYQHGHSVTKEYVVVVEECDKLQFKTKLEKFLKKELFIIGNLLFWEEGETLPHLTERKDIKLSSEEQHNTSSPKRKMSTTLPHWLDIMLFEELGAIHCPEHKRFEYNLDLDENETRTYLGTYFPRSYAESFCIFSNLFSNRYYNEMAKRMTTISILDFGCGTGGELLGLLTVIDKFVANAIKINVQLVDGNEHALNALRKILTAYTLHTKKQLNISVTHSQIGNTTELVNNNQRFDFILCNKVVCELISHKILTSNPYLQISQKLLPHLTEDGVFLLLDVTTKDNNSGLYYPQIMNRDVNSLLRVNNDFVNLLPLSCSAHKNCELACFTQQVFKVSHSRKRKEESKVCYRVICRKALWEEFRADCNKNATYIIQHQKSNIVNCSITNNTGIQTDAFDINATSS